MKPEAASASADQLRHEAKARLLAVLGEGYGADLERIVDCIVGAAVLECSSLFAQAMPPQPQQLKDRSNG